MNGADIINTNKVPAIIPSAGSGIRMGGNIPKQFMELAGRPLLVETLEKFQISDVISEVLVVAPPDKLDYCKEEIVEKYGISKVKSVVPGGSTRQASVRLGLEALGTGHERVLIHDGVRPFVDREMIERCVSESIEARAVVCAIPVKDTIKEVDEEGLVIKTIDRSSLWWIQTPQVFRYQDIVEAHRVAVEKGWDDITDDAMLVERMGITVKVIMGSEKNIKVTTPHDMEIARAILNSSSGRTKSGQ